MKKYKKIIKAELETEGFQCYICQRFGAPLCFLGKYRHDACSPGSRNWCNWYDLHPELHTIAGDLLRQGKG